MAFGQIGKYERLDVLGHGASGIVYLAKDTLLGKQVALKQISAQGEERERVLEEARVLDRLRHPNIVAVNGVDQIDGKILIDMEYVRGRNLQDLLREQPRLTPEQAVSITCQICDGLAYAHAHRTVHRDVKPANIIISHEGIVKLVDFGLAEVLGTNSFAGGAGTYAYMAPEDFHGEELSDRRADIWATGVILYEMLAGVRPFRAAKVKDPFSWKRSVEEDPIPPVTSLRGDLPAEIDAIIEHALARKKADRYGDAADMAAELRGLAIAPNKSTDHVAALVQSHPSYRSTNEALSEGLTRPATPMTDLRNEGSEDQTVAAVSPLLPAEAFASRPDVDSELATIAAVRPAGSAATSFNTAVVKNGSSALSPEPAGLPKLKDVDAFLTAAPDHWEAACRALEGRTLAEWLRSQNEGPLAELADELSHPQPSVPGVIDDPSARLRDFLYRAGMETVDEAGKRAETGVRGYDAGKFAEAAVDMRAAANLDPMRPHHFQYLARALRAQGNHAAAVSAFEEALTYHPNDRALRREYTEIAGSTVQITTQDVDFGVLRSGQEKTLKIGLRNTGGGTLQGRVMSAPEWLRVEPPAFATRQRQPLTLTVDTTKVWKTPSSYDETVVLETSGGRHEIKVALSVLPSRPGFERVWYWYVPLVIGCIAPIFGSLLGHGLGAAPGLIDAGLLSGAALVLSIVADVAWSLRWPMLAVAPFCFAAAVALLGHGHSASADHAIVTTTSSLVFLLLLQGFALGLSPKKFGKWQIWVTLTTLAGLGTAYVLTVVR